MQNSISNSPPWQFTSPHYGNLDCVVFEGRLLLEEVLCYHESWRPWPTSLHEEVVRAAKVLEDNNIQFPHYTLENGEVVKKYHDHKDISQRDISFEQVQIYISYLQTLMNSLPCSKTSMLTLIFLHNRAIVEANIYKDKVEWNLLRDYRKG